MAITNYTEARKQRTGYTHILSILFNGASVDWANRVTRWGVIRYSMSNYDSAFSGGIDEIAFADTEDSQPFWGSFYGANGTNPLWSTIEYVSSLGGPDGTFQFQGGSTSAKFGLFRFGELRFGETVLGGLVARGRTIEFSVRDNELLFKLQDDIDVLSKARFIWDYTPLQSGQYGTVYRILDDKTFVVEESSDDHLRGMINNLNLSGSLRTYEEQWKRLGNLGNIGTDAILPGDVLKFYGTSLFGTDAGSLLVQEKSYNVTGGSFYISGNGTFGTIEVTSALVNIKPGDRVYKKVPLIYTGNPGQIIYNMLTGSNTNLNFPSGSISSEHFHAATAACAPMNFSKVIIDESEGAVLNEIKQISEPLEAKFFFNRTGEFVWMPYRPRLRDNIDILADFYDALAAGTDNIISDTPPTFRQRVDSVYNRYKIEYDYNDFEDVSEIAFRSTKEIVAPPIRQSYYNGYQGFKEFQSYWIKDTNESVVIGNRFLKHHATAIPAFEFVTSLYGLEEELYNIIHVTHRSGSLTNYAFSIEDVSIDIDSDTISISSEGIGNLRFQSGYGYYNSGSAIGAVSGTSKCGWSWPVSHGAAGGSMHHGFLQVALGSTGTLISLGNGYVRNDGLTKYITIGSEIIRITSNEGDPDPLTCVRGVETTYLHATSYGSGVPYAMWPMDENGDIKAIYNGTELYSVATKYVSGTVYNINTGTYGTVWRWF